MERTPATNTGSFKIFPYLVFFQRPVNFELTLDLKKNYKNNRKSSPKPFARFP